MSLIVRVPLELLEPKVTIGDEALKASGEAPDNVTVPLALIEVAPAIAPALDIPPALLFIPPVIDAPLLLVILKPPEEIVCKAVKAFA